MIDLRSDTVTRPTEEMYRAMVEAEVGDDVYGEDPTVRELEEKGAELVGKEAALFLPSGTMGNQVAILAHTFRGDEVIADAASHIAGYEVGSPAMLAGVQLRTVPNLLEGDTVNEFSACVRSPDIHFPPLRLLCLENTFNLGGGTVMEPEEMKRTWETAREQGVSVHLDGARIFNSAVSLQREVTEFTYWCHSIMFCLSKGLAAPVGSLLAGDATFMEKARRYRKALGGGMRQAGVLAAAGLVALEMIPRLEEDHQHARWLGEQLSSLRNARVELDRVQTNMVYLELTDLEPGVEEILEELKKRGVLAGAKGSRFLRLVTHQDLSTHQIEQAGEIVKKVVEEKGA